MPSNADSLAALSALIDEMLAQPEGERERWIANLDPRHAAFVPALREMLQETVAGPENSSAADTLWDQLAPFSRRVLDEPQPIELETGRLVGPYRLIRPLGRGGMGVVWLAERADGTFKRQAALKLPYAGAQHHRLAERFARERDILASLDHPHIARLYDAGAGADGQPYLAMEVVQGEPITVHCERAGLGVAARLVLFRQVLGAVQYAHNRLVVHRDLKPSNILVGADGAVHLLDFGIAMLVDQAADQPASPLTEMGLALMTPDYASPEQIEHKGISTASDVYSLGVVLFELLSGVRPHGRGTDSRHALEAAILRTEPLKPSRATRADPVRRRQLEGDLDNIVLKALRKVPGERYPSADAFSQDIQRHLDGQPVLAHPDSLAYRTRKFVGRNRLAVGAAAVTGLALIGGTGVALHQAARAEREAQKAVAVQEFLVGLFDEADPARVRGRELTARDLMARGERDRAARLAAHPELSAALGGVLADIYIKLDDAKHALPLAQEQVDRLRQEGSAGPPLAFALARLADVQHQLSQYEASLASAREARRLLAPQAAAYPKQALSMQAREAMTLSWLARHAEAQPMFVDVVEKSARLYGVGSWEVIDAKSELAVNHARAGDPKAAAAIYAEIEPLLDGVKPEKAVSAAYLRNNMGYTQWLAGRWDDAERSLIRTRETIDALVGPRNELAIGALRTLGSVYQYRGNYTNALAAFDEATRRAVDFYGADDGETAINGSFRIAALLLLGRYAEAEDASLNGLRIAAVDRNFTDVDRRNMSRQRAAVLVFTGRADEALKQLRPIAEAEAAIGRLDSATAATRHFIAAALRLQGQHGRAAEEAGQAAAMWAKVGVGTTSVQRAKALITETLALADLGEPAQAAEKLALARQLLADKFAPAHPLFRVAEIAEAAIRRAEGRTVEAQAQEAVARAALAQQQVRLPSALPMIP